MLIGITRTPLGRVRQREGGLERHFVHVAKQDVRLNPVAAPASSGQD